MKRICLYMGIVMVFLVTPAWAMNDFTDESSFLGQILPGYYLEDFVGYNYGSPLNETNKDFTFGPVYGFSWKVEAPLGLFSTPGALSTFDGKDKLFITFLGLPVTAVGGIFASTDIDANVIDANVTVILNDGTSATITGIGFLGFTSAMPIVYVTVDGIGDLNWPQMDHFYVGAMAGVKVPEPSIVLLLGSGLVGLLVGLKKKARR